MTERETLPEEASSTWRRLLDEAAELAEGYRDRGWTATVVHPGDVTPVNTGDRFGLSVLAPDSEYDRVRSLADSHAFDRSQVYRRVDDGVTYLVCVFETAGDNTALVVPVYVTETGLDLLSPRARDAGEMEIHVRPLAYEERVALTVADPEPFFTSEG